MNYEVDLNSPNTLGKIMDELHQITKNSFSMIKELSQSKLKLKESFDGWIHQWTQMQQLFNEYKFAGAVKRLKVDLKNVLEFLDQMAHFMYGVLNLKEFSFDFVPYVVLGLPRSEQIPVASTLWKDREIMNWQAQRAEFDPRH
ncbi:hypothetical protein FGIG_04499 [Fasciola gigantica]|uniref:Uncharacterized protein n=1 Tax=Fasciola gigantica TaxID=46835 RepID=A0A504YGG0_FASGI|nr:hypothetical protein FGIG_04499 [Fasciola gigantica]